MGKGGQRMNDCQCIIIFHLNHSSTFLTKSLYLKSLVIFPLSIKKHKPIGVYPMDSTKHVKLLTGGIYKEFNVRNLFNSLIDVFSMVMKW